MIGVTVVLSLPLNVFCKSAICPSSEDLLLYSRTRLNLARRSLIEAHLANCDFCRAELQLLARYRPQPELIAVAQMPIKLRELAEYVFKKDERLANRISAN